MAEKKLADVILVKAHDLPKSLQRGYEDYPDGKR
jgi:hypothetical protein